ncbi:hypothetical protein G7Y89_g8823 [Cudoniella acicularis]|uniref:AMP-dependent synthetase/ligase domain-containing protein n=1 Tax=Cudoniella acicularis TaxID=354080 RepID=A0A8H4W0Q6_9HELO|nr:hypothetical protein G7Y89_g8823 [Cudoniella acicularis]
MGRQSAFGKLGETIPSNDIHAISVSLPTWNSTIGWGARNPAILDRMRTGYPNFFIHRLIDELAEKIVTRIGYKVHEDSTPTNRGSSPELKWNLGQDVFLYHTDSSPHTPTLRHLLTTTHIDSYFPLDASIMELYTRDFVPRVTIASKNASLVVDFLHKNGSNCVQQIYYPKGSPSQNIYDKYREEDGGYGYLLSVVSKEPRQAVAFFDALDVAKGPSLGTNFTLSCPYTCDARLKLAERGVDTMVLVFATSQYEQAVTFMVLYAIGATFIPMSSKILASEAEYFAKLYGATASISSGKDREVAAALEKSLGIPAIVPSFSLPASLSPISEFYLDPNDTFDLEKGLAIFSTSGTTGLPKGVVHTRRSLHGIARKDFGTPPYQAGNTTLFVRNSLWVYGIMIFTNCLHTKTKMEFCETVFTPEFFWERIKQGGIGLFCSVPSELQALMEYYDVNLRNLPMKLREQYDIGVSRCRNIVPAGGYISEGVARFWADVRGGVPLIVLYGSTESGIVSRTTFADGERLPLFCAGELRPNSEINLADGEEVIRAHSRRVFTYVVENALLSLPQIKEALVLGVPDDADGQERVAALILLHSHASNLSLGTLQKQLVREQNLPLFRLPTVIRFLKEDESIPKSTSGKPKKKEAKELYFDLELDEMRKDSRWEVGGLPRLEEDGDAQVAFAAWAMDYV